MFLPLLLLLRSIERNRGNDNDNDDRFSAAVADVVDDATVRTTHKNSQFSFSFDIINIEIKLNKSSTSLIAISFHRLIIGEIQSKFILYMKKFKWCFN